MVGLDGAFALRRFNGSTHGAFDEASKIGRICQASHINFTWMANLVRSLGATFDGVHVVGIFETDGATH